MLCPNCGTSIVLCPSCRTPNDNEAKFCSECGANLQRGATAATVQRTASSSRGVAYAGFWTRFVAALIDGFIVASGGAIIGVIFGLIYVLSTERFFTWWSDGTTDLVAVIAYLSDIPLGWIYYAGMESSSNQATLGKIFTGIAVTDLI